MKSSKRVFLSCVTSEMKEYRELIADDLRLPHIEVKTQEEFTTGGATLLEKLDDYISSCDVVVHLIGIRPGYAPTQNEIDQLVNRYPDFFEKIDSLIEVSSKVSYTQWEIWLAFYHNKFCLIYVLHTVTTSSGEQNDHLQRIRELGRDYRLFSGREDLRVQVLRDIQQIKEPRKKFSKRNIIVACGLSIALILGWTLFGPFLKQANAIRKFEIKKPGADATVLIESFSTDVFKEVRKEVPADDQNVVILAEFFDEASEVGDIFVKIVTPSETIFRTYSVSRSEPITFSTKKDVPQFDPFQKYPDDPARHPLFEIVNDRLALPIQLVYLEQGAEAELPNIYMGQTEVTLGNVRGFLEDQNEMSDMVLNLSDPDEMPVMIRSTRFALEFCRWLEESIEPRMRFRLPKLAEWRLAALDQIEKVNAAQSSADLSSLIQSANLTGVLTKTGSFQKSDNGFYDLIGNVAELCEPLHSLSLQNESVVAGGSCKTPSNELLDIEAIEPFDSMLPTGFRLAADASNDVNLSITNDCDKNIFVELRSLRMKRTTRVDEAFKSRHNNGTIPRVYPGWNLIRGKTEDGVMDDIETRYIPFVTTTDLRFTLVAGKLSISSDECPPLKPPVEE